MGTTMREILEEHAGGMRDGLTFRGLLPGGASTDFLVREHLDLPMDFESIQQGRQPLGTGTMIVLDDQTCPVGMVRNLEHFFAQESCGWCTPCRDGLPWVEQDPERARSRAAASRRTSSCWPSTAKLHRPRQHLLRAGAGRGRAAAERA